MRQLTADGRRIVDEVAQRHSVSSEAVMTLLDSLIAGGGAMAQFSHPDLGGMGQWSRGGMTMVGDMFNNALKARVDALCSELSDLLGRQSFAFGTGPGQSQSQSQGGGYGQGQSQGGGQRSSGGGFGETSLFVPGSGGVGGAWWPGDLGVPSSTGAQNNIRYAYFPGTRRLAIDVNGRVTVYDTRDHAISGVSQQQSGDASLTFTSQYGLVRVADLAVVSPGAETRGNAARPEQSVSAAPIGAEAEPRRNEPRDEPRNEGKNDAPPQPQQQPTPPADDVFALLERLAGLRDKGILSDEEFAAKKTELLSRL